MSSAVFIPLIPFATAPVRVRKASFLADCQRLAARLFASRRAPAAVATAPVLTAFQEAERVRAMADDLLKTDPDLAQELYAAADRHEYQHAARV
jgi:ABC-type oligopeptide transport system substrate-binding subunit